MVPVNFTSYSHGFLLIHLGSPGVADVPGVLWITVSSFCEYKRGATQGAINGSKSLLNIRQIL